MEPVMQYPFERASLADPPALLARLRESMPLPQVTMPSGHQAYLVTRHSDARRVLSDPVFSIAALWEPEAPWYQPGEPPPIGSSLRSLDPPAHTRLRRMVATAFSPRVVETLRPWITETTVRLLEGMGTDEPCADLMDALCTPLPIMAICQLLGVPYEDRTHFSDWSKAIMDGGTGTVSAWQAITGYLADLVEAKRETPGDDVLSTLVVEYGAELLTFELVVLATQLLVAGHETTTNQLGVSLFVLLREPDRYAALRAEPELVPGAVEELLRLHPAGYGGASLRVATHEVELAGVHVPAGSGVLIDPAAVNRDPQVFGEPDTMDLARSGAGHLTFGYGAHFCIGAALARAEIEIALRELLVSFPQLRLAVRPESIPWRNGPLVFGPLELTVTW
jgi:cytochrome P450